MLFFLRMLKPDEHIKKNPGILGSYQWPYSALILNPRASLETTYCTLVLNAAMFWH